MGTHADRALIRADLDKVHALVRSKESSPLSYNAFDPDPGRGAQDHRTQSTRGHR